MINHTFKDKITLGSVIVCALLFILLSLLHFYWSMGGEYWYEEVLPTNSTGTNRLNPSPASALIISLGMLSFAIIVIGTQGIFDNYVKRKYFRYGTLLIAMLFLIRSVGDFKFIGMFKTVKDTRFGINDGLIFTPLCLFIALLAFYIFFSGRKNKA